jgi:hypothetical protein
VSFSAKIVDLERCAFGDADLLRRKAPRAGRFVSGQFSDETGKGDLAISSVADASSGSDCRVKAIGIAIVSNIDGDLADFMVLGKGDSAEKKKRND